MDPDQSGKVDTDTDPDQSGKMDPDPHRREKQDSDLDPHLNEGYFGALEGSIWKKSDPDPDQSER
jgi:hypothetical protein